MEDLRGESWAVVIVYTSYVDKRYLEVKKGKDKRSTGLAQFAVKMFDVKKGLLDRS